MITRRELLLGLPAAACSAGSRAAAWPTRPVRIIVPGGPASPPDTAVRIVLDAVAARLGQALVIENKGGAQGVIGMDAVAKSAPDGYTFGVIHLQLATIPSMRSRMPFSFEKDLVPVVQVSTEGPVLVVRKDLPVQSLKELVRLARDQPGKLMYGSAGSGSPAHLAMELLKRSMSIDLVHVPYKTTGGAVTELAGGQIDVGFAGSAAVLPVLESRRVRALAVCSPRRLTRLPDIPTLAEAGFPLDLRGWVGLLAPAGTDPAIVARMNREVNAALENPKVRERLNEVGSEPAGGSSAAFAAHMAREAARWHKVVKDAGIVIE